MQAFPVLRLKAMKPATNKRRHNGPLIKYGGGVAFIVAPPLALNFLSLNKHAYLWHNNMKGNPSTSGEADAIGCCFKVYEE